MRYVEMFVVFAFPIVAGILSLYSINNQDDKPMADEPPVAKTKPMEEPIPTIPEPDDSPNDVSIEIKYEEEKEYGLGDFFYFQPVVDGAEVSWKAFGPKGPLQVVVNKTVQVNVGDTPGEVKIVAEFYVKDVKHIYWGPHRYDIGFAKKVSLVVKRLKVQNYKPPVIK